MINKLPEIYSRVKDAVNAQYPIMTDDHFSVNQLNIPSVFPFIAMSQINSVPERRMMDSSGREKYTRVLIQLNIYSNQNLGKNMEAEDILAVADEVMYGMNFTRESVAPMNLDSSTIYRLIARYEGVITDGGFYRT